MKRILTAIIFTAMALTSCSNKVDLNGEWKIISVGSEKVTETEAPPTLSFDTATGRFHGYTGVNIVNGDYVQEGRRLTLNGLGVTMMAGPEEDMALERKILDTYTQVHTTRLSDDGELHLLNADKDTVMTLARR